MNDARKVMNEVLENYSTDINHLDEHKFKDAFHAFLRSQGLNPRESRPGGENCSETEIAGASTSGTHFNFVSSLILPLLCDFSLNFQVNISWHSA